MNKSTKLMGRYPWTRLQRRCFSESVTVETEVSERSALSIRDANKSTVRLFVLLCSKNCVFAKRTQNSFTVSTSGLISSFWRIQKRTALKKLGAGRFGPGLQSDGVGLCPTPKVGLCVPPKSGVGLCESRTMTLCPRIRLQPCLVCCYNLCNCC